MSYGGTNWLASVIYPNGMTVAFSYDANGARTSTAVTPSGGSAATVNDYYQLGQLAYQTDGTGTLLASYTYDSQGTPVSVQVGSDPSTAPRYYYVYNAHGDVVNLVDASGNPVASYAYDTWGALTSASENFGSGVTWSNPYRYDGRDGVRYDAADGFSWMRVRAYDPTIGRFIARDPLGRAPLFFSDQPYAYAGNNPVSNVDPSGQRYTTGNGGGSAPQQKQQAAPKRVTQRKGAPKKEDPKTVARDKAMGIIDGLPEFARTFLLSLLSAIAPTPSLGYERAGLALILIGNIILLVDIVFTAFRDFDKEKAFELAFDAFSTLTNAWGALSIGHLLTTSSVYSGLSVVYAILSVLAGVFAWYRTLGYLAKIGADAAITGILMSADAEIAPEETAASAILGAAISYGMASVANLILFAGYKLVSIGYSLAGD